MCYIKRKQQKMCQNLLRFHEVQVENALIQEFLLTSSPRQERHYGHVHEPAFCDPLLIQLSSTQMCYKKERKEIQTINGFQPSQWTILSQMTATEYEAANCCNILLNQTH